MIKANHSIDELFVKIRNGLPVKNQPELGGLPITRIETIASGVIDENRVGFSGINPGEKSEWLLKHGDILFSHINSPAHIGKVAIYTDEPPELIHGMNLLAFTPNPDLLHPEFGLYLLRSKEFKSQLAKSVKPAVNQASVAIADIKKIRVNVPTVSEQKRIAAILDKADNLRHKRQQTIRLADDFLRAVFLDMFGDPVTNSRKWPEKEIYEVAKVTTGNTPSREMPENFGATIEWIKSDNINTPSHWLTKAKEGLSEQGLSLGRIAPAGSTLMTCIAGSPSCIGNVAMADREVAFNQQINALTPFKGTEPEFLYGLLLYSKQRVQAASTNSMKGMVSKGALERVRLIWPPAPLQSAYAIAFSKITALREKQIESDSSPLLSSLQDSLLS